jgi:hypothetical protein
MRRFLLAGLLILFLWMFPPGLAAAQEATSTPEATSAEPLTSEPPLSLPAVEPGISFPQPDTEVQGVINILGFIPSENLATADLAFSYAADSTDTWFPLALAPQPAEAGLIATWDTTRLSDGFYNLRLRLYMSDGVLVRTVKNIRIRNYSPIETPTLPASSTFTPTALPSPTPPLPTDTVTPTFTPAPSATPLPPNPATLSQAEILLNLGKGALAVLAVFTVFGLLLAISQKLRS